MNCKFKTSPERATHRSVQQPEPTLKTIRVITVVYASFIAFIVLSASNRWFPAAFQFVHAGKNDKMFHFVLVGTMAFLLNLSLGLKSVSPRNPYLLYGSLIMLTVATVEEFAQNFMSHRTFDWLDLLCNCLGIFILGTAALLFRPRYRSSFNR